MAETSIDMYDAEEGYCRMLGHHVPFRYCRTMKSDLPCHWILDCWFERIPVEEYIKTYYNEEERLKIFERPKPKIESLIEIIERAKKNKDIS